MAKKDKKHPKESLDEPFLLSPQFEKQGGWGKGFSNWWQKYFKSVILPTIIVILIAGGIYAYTSRQEKLPEIENVASLEGSQPQIEIQENQIQELEKQTQPPSEILDLGEEAEKTELTITSETTEIKQKAQAGEGVTHLARKALKKYLEDVAPEINLSPEQKIYSEDYIQNKTANRPLEVNEELSFSPKVIEDAISQAQNLNSGQIENLSKYVPLVPSL